MSRKLFYNNIGITALGIAFVVWQGNPMPLSKALLILPLFTHKELLNYLSSSNVKIKSLEKLIIERTSYFSNFNQRYYDSLCSSLNSFQVLHEIELASVKDSQISVISEIPYDETMGRRAKKIHKASRNIAAILDDNVEKLYLNLRVEL